MWKDYKREAEGIMIFCMSELYLYSTAKRSAKESAVNTSKTNPAIIIYCLPLFRKKVVLFRVFQKSRTNRWGWEKESKREREGRGRGWRGRRQRRERLMTVETKQSQTCCLQVGDPGELLGIQKPESWNGWCCGPRSGVKDRAPGEHRAATVDVLTQLIGLKSNLTFPYLSALCPQWIGWCPLTLGRGIWFTQSTIQILISSKSTVADTQKLCLTDYMEILWPTQVDM